MYNSGKKDVNTKRKWHTDFNSCATLATIRPDAWLSCDSANSSEIFIGVSIPLFLCQDYFVFGME